MFILRKLWHLPRNICIFLLDIYQKTISPDHSKFMKVFFPNGHCKYQPTCSDYAKISIKKRGFIIGILKSIWRLFRCNPFSKGGLDLPK